MNEFVFAAYYALITAGIIYAFSRKKKRSVKDKEIDKTESTLELLCLLLKRLNCQPEINKDGEEVYVNFDFQGGHFRAITRTNSPFIQLTFLYCYLSDVDYLNLFRKLCNDFNIHSTLSKCIYSTSVEDNSVNLHIFSGFLLTKEVAQEKYYFQNYLSDCFDLRNAFVSQFNREKEKTTEGQNIDQEHQEVVSNRMLYLLREQEFKHQQENWQWRAHETKKIILNDLLSLFHENESLTLLELKVVTEVIRVYSDPEQIKEFDLLSPLLYFSDGKAKLRCDQATLLITYRLPSQEGGVGRTTTTTLHIQSDGYANNSFYFGMTYVLPPLRIDKAISLGSQENQSHVYSFLIAFDQLSEAQKQTEFEFLWEDAKEKVARGKRDELTEEQELLVNCLHPSLGYLYYWGQKHFLAKRYYEALLYLENGYYRMQSRFHELSESEKELFYKICYMVGFCYNEFSFFQRGYFFLDITYTQYHIKYSMEYINGLANSKDFRAITVIDDLLSSLLNNKEHSEAELPPHVISFVHFLRRRRAYIFIDQGRLDEATEVFTKMLDEPENSDYALNELAYIQHLKARGDSV